MGIPDNSGGLWRWVVMAQVSCCCCSSLPAKSKNGLQVKEGTEKRGALQSVFRLVRKEVSRRMQFKVN